jgi:hypothetical protein
MQETTPDARRQTPDPTSSLRGFWSLIVTQFQGAFSDNALKQLALFIGISLGFKEREQDGLIMLSLALLTLPFIFFSMFGGSSPRGSANAALPSRSNALKSSL